MYLDFTFNKANANSLIIGLTGLEGAARLRVGVPARDSVTGVDVPLVPG